jgi:hypothetical protein
MADLPDERPGRALLTAVAAMAGVAVLVGLTVGGVLLGVVRASGLENAQAQEEAAPQSLFIPKYKPTKAADEDLGLPSIAPSKSPSVEGRSTSSASPSTDQITLTVAPKAVSPGERINFNGAYVNGEGVQLQIQRREGGSWTDFPVLATVQGGSFQTWIQTSHTGRQLFRVYDPQADRASKPVAVTVG